MNQAAGYKNLPACKTAKILTALTMLTMLTLHSFYLVRVVRVEDIRVAWLVYLDCLRSNVLRAYCNFESKQAISITLFGRRPNNK